MDEQTTTLTGSWSTHELRALATLCDRLGWRDFRDNADDEGEAYRMRDAVYKLMQALDSAGYEPR